MFSPDQKLSRTNVVSEMIYLTDLSAETRLKSTREIYEEGERSSENDVTKIFDL